jgi:hypothetical protein
LGAELNAVLAQETLPLELEERAAEAVKAGRKTRSAHGENSTRHKGRIKDHWPEVTLGTVMAAIAVWGAAVKPRLRHQRKGTSGRLI